MFTKDIYNAKDYKASLALRHIDTLNDDYVMSCDFNELTEYIESRYSFEKIVISNIPVFDWEEPEYGQRNYRLKCKYEITSGVSSLEYTPSSYTYSFGSGIPNIEQDFSTNIIYIVFSREMDIDVVERKIEEGGVSNEYLVSLFNYETKMFFGNVSNLSKDIASANSDIHSRIVNKLTQIYKLANRKISLRNALKISAMPISDIRNKKVELKIIQKNTTLPKPNVSDPYYYISNEDYDLIIQIINRCMIQYERTPETFKDLGEEDIRNIILGAINANFNFSGSAESFSNKGHTDIMIETENKAAFIAECKLWKGKSYVSSGINQLLNYATYKDGKLALLVFNKDNKDFDNVISEMTNLINEHNFMISKIYNKNNVWQYKFHSQTNETAVTVTFILANYYFK